MGIRLDRKSIWSKKSLGYSFGYDEFVDFDLTGFDGLYEEIFRMFFKYPDKNFKPDYDEYAKRSKTEMFYNNKIKI